MSNVSDTDFLIVGQGLAGTILALTLLEKGSSVKVIDNHHLNASSMVAAGMYNPIVFKKLNKSWRIDELLPEMHQFYGFWEQRLGQKFIFEQPIARVFPGVDYENDWLAKSSEPSYEAYLADDEGKDLPGINLRFKQGFGQVKQSGHVAVESFLLAARSYLESQQALIDAAVDYEEIGLTEDGATYQGNKFKKVIFCEGYQGIGKNPWFSDLPFGNTKGELLTITAQGLPTEHIANLGVWMLPIGNNNYKVGATFAWDDVTTDCTAAAREKIENEIKQLTSVPYTVKLQQAGIRPTCKDRRPVVGLHQAHQQLGVFNGLGPKGVSIAPWTAARFAEFLLQGTPLPNDIDINRFKK